jgi:MbtH protein
MNHQHDDDQSDDVGTHYAVVVNDEDQYSIWPAEREVPAGWRRTGTVGPKADCLQEIERVWTDMRPRSLRRWMQSQPPAAPSGAAHQHR